MEGRVDGFTCAAGTGGTIAGTGLGLKAKDAGVTVALTDPHGAGLYNYYKCGELKPEGSSVVEGIGKNRITSYLEAAPIDTPFRITFGRESRRDKVRQYVQTLWVAVSLKKKRTANLLFNKLQYN